MLTACNFNIFTQQTLILPELIEKLRSIDYEVRSSEIQHP